MNPPTQRKNILISLTLFAVVCFAAAGAGAQDSTPQRPRITGISHVGFFVSDLPAALSFWHNFLGFDESYDLKKPNSDQIRIAFIKINDHQHIELFNEPPKFPRYMLSHICFSVDNLQQMRTYLRARGTTSSRTTAPPAALATMPLRSRIPTAYSSSSFNRCPLARRPGPQASSCRPPASRPVSTT